jgi:DNA-binding NtrC family response regulator
MTGAAAVDTAIESVKNGALDYLTKPLDFSRLGRLFDDVKRGLEERERLLAADATVARQAKLLSVSRRALYRWMERLEIET